MFLSDEGPMLETLDFTTRIGSIPTFLYFDFNHMQVLLKKLPNMWKYIIRSFAITSRKSRSDAMLVDFQNKNGQHSEAVWVFGLLQKLDGGPEKKGTQKRYRCVGLTLTRLESIPNIPTKSTKMTPDDWTWRHEQTTYTSPNYWREMLS